MRMDTVIGAWQNSTIRYSEENFYYSYLQTLQCQRGLVENSLAALGWIFCSNFYYLGDHLQSTRPTNSVAMLLGWMRCTHRWSAFRTPTTRQLKQLLWTCCCEPIATRVSFNKPWTSQSGHGQPSRRLAMKSPRRHLEGETKQNSWSICWNIFKCK